MVRPRSDSMCSTVASSSDWVASTCMNTSNVDPARNWQSRTSVRASALFGGIVTSADSTPGSRRAVPAKSSAADFDVSSRRNDSGRSLGRIDRTSFGFFLKMRLNSRYASWWSTNA